MMQRVGLAQRGAPDAGVLNEAGSEAISEDFNEAPDEAFSEDFSEALQRGLQWLRLVVVGLPV